MQNGRVILQQEPFQIIIERLCHQLIERHDTFEDTCLVGIQSRGVLLSNRIHQRLQDIIPGLQLQYGKLDITFYRDDFRTRKEPLRANTTEMNFLVEDKKVILVDDVLYTGRTVQAALTALTHYGRPRKVELLALVDRRFNRHLPIKADYVGIRIDSVDEAYVKVEWTEQDAKDQILLFGSKEDMQ